MNFLKLFNHIPIIGAHRGASLVAPENTLAALKKSVGKCDFIEVDVEFSRDKVAVVMHDETLQRTTNVKELKEFKSREPYRVCDFSFEELLKLDYGSWFYKDDAIKYSEPLLTLYDTLKFIKENKLYINIEIKDMHHIFSDEIVVTSILKEIESSNTQNQVLLSSFRAEYLEICKVKCAAIPTALIVYNESKSIEYLKNLKIDAYHLNDEFVDVKSVHKMKKAGFFVNVYTVNDNIRAKELFGMGVNGVFSDI